MRSLLPAELMPFLDEIGLTQDQKDKFAAFAKRATMKDERVAFAVNLLHLQATRSEIRERLMSLYELSRRQAYRIISDALEVRGNCAIEMAQRSVLIMTGENNHRPDQKTEEE